jgi:toxin YoeB
MKLIFAERAWDDYQYWQSTNRKSLARINTLIAECMRTPFSGRGKPEPLKQDLAGYWSRRIDDEHRLVYKVSNEGLLIAQCRHHYRSGRRG